MDDCHFSPGRTTKMLPHFPQRNDAARRFDCPAFRRALETGQPNRRNREPIRSRTQRAFLKSRDSTAVPSAPISETSVQCRRKLAPDFSLRYVFFSENDVLQSNETAGSAKSHGGNP
jgi:hypothetical protein